MPCVKFAETAKETFMPNYSFRNQNFRTVFSVIAFFVCNASSKITKKVQNAWTEDDM